jgi:hypothetical protein
MIKILFAVILIIFSVPLLMMAIALEPTLAARKPSHTELSKKDRLRVLDNIIFNNCY